MNVKLRVALAALLLAASCDEPSSTSPAVDTSSVPPSAPASAGAIDTADVSFAAADAPLPFLRGTATAQAGAMRLRTLAATRGAIRVVVGFDVPFRPEGQLRRPGALDAQLRRIAAGQQELLARHAGPGLQVVHTLDRVPFFGAKVTPAVLDALLADPSVTSIEEDRVFPMLLADSVPLVGGTVAHGTGHTGAGQVIAMVDGGVDTSHPFFAGRVVDEACYSSADGGYSLCAGGAPSLKGPGSAPPCDGTVVENCDHATHVAGILASDDPTYQGMAPDVELAIVQVFTGFVDPVNCTPLDCTGASLMDIIAGMKHVLELKQGGMAIAAVTMSLGGDRYTTSCDGWSPSTSSLIESLRSLGTATVVAAGNDAQARSVSWPACISSAIAVGATTKADAIDTTYSNGGDLITLLAPGTGIVSSVPGGGVAPLDGTSVAAPHVAGAWALLKQRLPPASVSEALLALQRTGVMITDPRTSIVKPRIQVDRAFDDLRLDAVTFSPLPGEYGRPQFVTIASNEGVGVRYTLDGSTPDATNGTVITSGDMVEVNAPSTLSAYAYYPRVPDTAVLAKKYWFPATATVTLLPAGAVNSGARFRQSGYSVETFEDGNTDRYTWVWEGHGAWVIGSAVAHESHYSMRPNVVNDGDYSKTTLTFQSDGGDIKFWYKTSTELNGDVLRILVDGAVRDIFSGEIDWTQASYTVGAGQHSIGFTYAKDAGGIAGKDLVWIDDLELPGDQWRQTGTTVRGVNRNNLTLTFKDAGGSYQTPANDTLFTKPFDRLTPTYTYVRNQVAPPVFDPPAGSYNTSQNVRITSTSPGATIRYTTDGSIPTGASTLYTTPIPVALGTTKTIRAISQISGWADGTAQAIYEIADTVSRPTFTPAPGTYTSPQSIVIATTTTGATIRYTTDGSDPGPTSPVYAGPIATGQGSSLTVKAVATRSGWTDSPIATGSWTVTGTVDTPRFSIPPGRYATSQTLTLAVSTPGATIRYTLNGNVVTSSSPAYTGPIVLGAGTTTRVRTKAFKPSWVESAEADGTFELTGTVGTPVATPAPGVYTTAQTVKLTAQPATAVIHYTTDGSAPTTSSPIYTGTLAVPLDSTLTLRAFATVTDWTDSGELSGVWRVTGSVDAPSISPSGGTYTTPQDVTITAASGLDTVRYTTDGTAPTAASTAYTGPVHLGTGTTVTIKAASFRTDWATSPVVSAAFEVTGKVSTPTSNPAPGTWADLTSIELATATAGATLRYTTDGSPVTATSAVYTAPIPIASQQTVRVRARATKADWIDSDELDGTYRSTGAVAAPTLQPPPGTYTTAQMVSVSTSTPGATLHVTTDGTAPTAASPTYVGPIPVGLGSTVQVRAIALVPDWIDSPEAGGSYVVTGTVQPPSFSIPPDTYVDPQVLVLTTPTPGATIRYTTDGSPVTAASSAYAAPIPLAEDTITRVRARAFLASWGDSPEIDGTFEITGQVAPPVFSPPPGTYIAAQQVRASSDTAGATIRYTTNGTDPNASSTVWTGPLRLALGTVTRIKARAFRDGWTPSDVATGTWVLTPSVSLGWSGSPPVGGQVAPGTSAALVIAGGAGPFELAPVMDADGTVAEASVFDRDVTVDLPASGAFAGRYTVRVTDLATGDEASLEIAVPPWVQVSKTSLAPGETVEVTVLGGTPRAAFPLALTDPGDSAGHQSSLSEAATPTDDPGAGNPATATLVAGVVIDDVVLQVRATVDTVTGRSDELRIDVAGDDGGDTDVVVDETDAPGDSDAPPETDVETSTDDPGTDGGTPVCGCATGGAPGWPAGLALLALALRRRRSVA